MTKREQYSLSFYKTPGPAPYEKTIHNVCYRSGPVNDYNELQIIGNLNIDDTQGLIDELSAALTGAYFEEYYMTDGTEYQTIHLVFPNVIFGENDLTIAMSDLKELLEEWLVFIS